MLIVNNNRNGHNKCPQPCQRDTRLQRTLDQPHLPANLIHQSNSLDQPHLPANLIHQSNYSEHGFNAIIKGISPRQNAIQRADYEIEANKRMTQTLKRQLAAREQKKREAANKKTIESSNCFSKMFRKMQLFLTPKNDLYQSIPSFAQEGLSASKQVKKQ